MNTDRTYRIHRRLFVVRDGSGKTQNLRSLFRDSNEMFHLRMQKLGNVSAVTTEEDSEVLRLMLDALIEAKRKIQGA